jgi:hypothetical protein
MGNKKESFGTVAPGTKVKKTNKKGLTTLTIDIDHEFVEIDVIKSGQTIKIQIWNVSELLKRLTFEEC